MQIRDRDSQFQNELIECNKTNYMKIIGYSKMAPTLELFWTDIEKYVIKNIEQYIIVFAIDYWYLCELSLEALEMHKESRARIANLFK